MTGLAKELEGAMKLSSRTKAILNSSLLLNTQYWQSRPGLAVLFYGVVLVRY